MDDIEKKLTKKEKEHRVAVTEMRQHMMMETQMKRAKTEERRTNAMDFIQKKRRKIERSALKEYSKAKKLQKRR